MGERQTFSPAAPAAMVMYVASLSASAQTVVTGHYMSLFAGGLKSGSLPTRPGWIHQNSTFFYHTTSFRDDTGREVGGAQRTCSISALESEKASAGVRKYSLTTEEKSAVPQWLRTVGMENSQKAKRSMKPHRSGNTWAGSGSKGGC